MVSKSSRKFHIKEFVIYGGVFILLLLLSTNFRSFEIANNINSIGAILGFNVSLLPAIIAIFALVRFYAKKNNKFLFIGTGFLGAAILDGYDAIMTILFINTGVGVEYNDVAFFTWGWFVSRLFLSEFLFLSWWTYELEQRMGKKGRIGEYMVYTVAWLLLVASFVLLGFVDLPTVYNNMSPVSRPLEIIPGVFFLVAFIGYLKKYSWVKKGFDFWLILSLIVSFLGQILFMAFSREVYDPMYSFADVFKIISYLMVFIGLVFDMYFLFRKAEESKNELKKFEEALEQSDNKAVITDPGGVIVYMNKAAEEITGFKRRFALGKKTSIWGGQMSDKFYKKLWKVIKNKRVFKSDIKNKTKNGKVYLEELSIAPVLDENKTIKYYVSIGRDVTEARKIEEAKSEFVALASHQLRNPLWVTKWLLESFSDSIKGKLDKEEKKMIKDVNESNERMIKLVQSLLNVSKMEMGEYKIELHDIDINRVVRSSVKLFKPLLEEKGIKLKLHLAKEVGEIKADEDLIYIVIESIISNAIKYSKEDSDIIEIKTELDKKGKYVLLSVKDNGIGILDEDKEKIFEKLFRADNAKKQDPNGSGLSLYISKIIMSRLGGDVLVESKEKEGSTFTLKFKNK